MPEIDATEMRRRLVNLCTGNDKVFPGKEKDRHVMLVAASRTFERGFIYTEKEVDTAIREWLEKGCPALLIDEVTVRRELIDANYLKRDDAGRFYAVGDGPASITFAEDVGEVDPVATVTAAIEERAARKRAHGT